MSYKQSGIIKTACELIGQGDIADADQLIRSEYPFSPKERTARSYTPRQMTRVFLRDGFIDQYRGMRLVHPPVLRLVSHYLPEAFPYHKNGKLDKGHFAYWEIFPTIDHVDPIGRGGEDIESNWVCCSMLTNSIKSNWSLQELHWELVGPGDLGDWDGMFSWFLRHVEGRPELCQSPYIKNWFNAAVAITREMALSVPTMIETEMS